MALLSLFCPSEFLLPDYLSHMQEEEGLGHFEMSEQTFEASSSSSSVQTPVISQVTSTMNYDNHTSAPPSQTPNPRSGNGGEAAQVDHPKSTAAVTSLQDPEEVEGEKERGGRKKKRLVSITIEWKRSIRVNIRGVTVHKIHGSVRYDTEMSRFGSFSIQGAGQMVTLQCWKYFCFKPWRRANGYYTSTPWVCTRANFAQDLCWWTS